MSNIKLELKRFSDNNFSIFGVLFVDDWPFCCVVEPSYSREKFGPIPAGDYEIVEHNSKKYPRCWRLEPTPGRVGILIHAGNTTLPKRDRPWGDTKGCLLVGAGWWHGTGVSNSATIKEELYRTLIAKGNKHAFKITEQF